MFENAPAPATAQPQQQKPQEYAFTEIKTFHVPVDKTLEEENSTEGGIWASTICTYLENEGTGLVWWGRLFDVPGVVKLVIDWRTRQHHTQFSQSAQFQALQQSWTALADKPVETSSYVFPNWENTRRNAFTKSSYGAIVSCILTFSFPPSSAASLTQANLSQWQSAWDQFSHLVLRSEGGVVSSGTCGGWSLDHRSFCGIVKWIDMESMRGFLGKADEKLGFEGGLGVMRKMSEGMSVEFAGMWCLEDGWLGSVTKGKKDNPGLQKMLGRFRKDLRGEVGEKG